MRTLVLIISLILFCLVTGCENQRDSPEGFRLPEGDADAGAKVYAELSCGSCHSVPTAEGAEAPAGIKRLKLGSVSSNLPSDGYLVTAIINPNHVIKVQEGFASTTPDGKSRMLDFNRVLTVQQLVDLVAYLHTMHEFRTAYEAHGLPDG